MAVACYIKSSLSYNYKENFSKNLENIFIDIHLPKSKPILLGILYRPPDKNSFVKYLEDVLRGTNILDKEECYLLGDFNINLLIEGKDIFRCKSDEINHKQMSSMTKEYLDLCLSFSLKQLISVPTRVTETTATLIDHILTNSSQKIIQSGVIELGLSDHELIYCTRKSSLSKSNKHNEVVFRLMKNYTIQNFLEILKKN